MIIRDGGTVRVERVERLVWLTSGVVAILGVALILLSWPGSGEFQPGRTLPLIGVITLFVVVAIVVYLRTRHVVIVEPGRVGVGTGRREPRWFARDEIRLVTVRGGPITRIIIHDLGGRLVLAQGLMFLSTRELREVLGEAGLPLR